MPGLDTLRLFGVIHHDRKGKVAGELAAFVDTGDAAGDGGLPAADAVFIEYPREGTTLRRALAVLARVPAYFVGAMLLQLLFYAPLFLVFARDLLPTEVVAAVDVAGERDLPVHRVDEHPNTQLLDAGPVPIAVNWAAIVGVVLLTSPVTVGVTAVLGLVGGLVPVVVRKRDQRVLSVVLAALALAAAAGVVVAGYFSVPLLAVGVVAFLYVLVTTVDRRNDVMLDRVATIAAEEGYEDAVLVTGKAHLVGMVRLADDLGFEVSAIHVSAWLRAGRTYDDPADASLPEVGVSGDGVPEDVVPHSERDVLGKRLLAGLLDYVFASALATLVLLGGTLAIDWYTGLSNPAIVLVTLPLTAMTWFGYYLYTESRHHRTLGKARFGLAVASADGGPPSFLGTVARTVLRPVDLFAFGIGVVMLVVTDRRQRIGDVFGNTVVGRARHDGDTG